MRGGGGGRGGERGGGGGTGISSITQRDFDIGLLYIFLLAEFSPSEDFGDNLFVYFIYWGAELQLDSHSWGGGVDGGGRGTRLAFISSSPH